MLNLDITGIKDRDLRTSLYDIQEEFQAQDVLNGKFKHFSIVFTAEVTNFRYSHRLGFKPLDAWFTSQIGTGTLSAGRAEFNYSLFDRDFFDITTTGPVTVRFFIGSFVQGSQA